MTSSQFRVFGYLTHVFPIPIYDEDSTTFTLCSLTDKPRNKSNMFDIW